MRKKFCQYLWVMLASVWLLREQRAPTMPEFGLLGAFGVNSAAQGTQGTCNPSSLLGYFEPFNETHGAHSQLSWHSVSLGQGLICGEAQAKQGGLQPLKNTWKNHFNGAAKMCCFCISMAAPGGRWPSSPRCREPRSHPGYSQCQKLLQKQPVKALTRTGFPRLFHVLEALCKQEIIKL